MTAGVFGTTPVASQGDLFARMVEACPVAALATDPQGRILVFNAAAVSLLGCSAQLACEMHQASDFYQDSNAFGQVLEVLAGRPADAAETRRMDLRTPSGGVVPVRATHRLLRDGAGRPWRVVGYFEDIRQAVELQQRLEDVGRQLIEGERRVEAAEKGRSVAHELNQPLTVAMGTLELIHASFELPGPVRQRMDRVYDQLQRMTRMVKKLSSASRPPEEAGYESPASPGGEPAGPSGSHGGPHGQT